MRTARKVPVDSRCTRDRSLSRSPSLKSLPTLTASYSFPSLPFVLCSPRCVWVLYSLLCSLILHLVVRLFSCLASLFSRAWQLLLVCYGSVYILGRWKSLVSLVTLSCTNRACWKAVVLGSLVLSWRWAGFFGLFVLPRKWWFEK